MLGKFQFFKHYSSKIELNVSLNPNKTPSDRVKCNVSFFSYSAV